MLPVSYQRLNYLTGAAIQDMSLRAAHAAWQSRNGQHRLLGFWIAASLRSSQ